MNNIFAVLEKSVEQKSAEYISAGRGIINKITSKDNGMPSFIFLSLSIEQDPHSGSKTSLFTFFRE